MLPAPSAGSPPRVVLSRDQWIRLIVVGIFVVFGFSRVAPDAVRIVMPLGFFGYATNADGVVEIAPSKRPPGTDVLRVGDRVRIDRIKPFDRKPGIAGNGFTRENFERRLPIEHGGRIGIVRLKAYEEPVAVRVTVIVRIIVYAISFGLGAILFLIKPSLTTFGFFIFSLGGDYPTTFADVYVPNPFRPIPIYVGDALRAAARPALFLFALCLLTEDRHRQRIAAVGCAGLAILVGIVHAQANYLRDFAGRPALMEHDFDVFLGTAISVFTGIALIATVVRTTGIRRRRAGWIVVSFVAAIATRLASDAWYPAHIPVQINSLFVSASVLPIVAVWVGVVRDRFFDVDFVVSRAIIYVAVVAAIVGLLTVAEETTTYIFYNNTDLATLALIGLSTLFGLTTGKLLEAIRHLVDRFVFRGRHQQRVALEFIAGYILDAENVEDVHRALLEDASHALGLAFGGILTRRPSGDYELEHRAAWPDDFVVRLGRDDALTRAIAHSRGALQFSGKESALIKTAFPKERLTFAAPLFEGREMVAIVVYGHSVSGLDLDPEERELLVRVVSHASIALGSIELAKYRAQAETAGLPAPS